MVSWQGAYIIKNFLGTVPVHEDGSAYFEAPPGRAIYLEALDADGRRHIVVSETFLSQEMLREANTMASKSHDTSLVDTILDVLGQAEAGGHLE